MSKIGVALALCVLLLGAVLFIGNLLVVDIVDRGQDIGGALTGVSVNTNGVPSIKMP